MSFTYDGKYVDDGHYEEDPSKKDGYADPEDAQHFCKCRHCRHIIDIRDANIEVIANKKNEQGETIAETVLIICPVCDQVVGEEEREV